MGWTAEDAEDFVVAYLGSNLAGQISTIATARSVTIPAPHTITKDDNTTIQVPHVLVKAGPVTYDWGPDDAPLKEGPVRDFAVEFTVTTAVRAQDTQQGLRQTLQRYEEALVDLMVADWTFGDNSVRITSNEADFTPEGTDDETKMRYQSMLLTALLRRHP